MVVSWRSEGTLQQRIARVSERHAGNPLVMEVVEFVTNESSRSLTVPA